MGPIKGKDLVLAVISFKFQAVVFFNHCLVVKSLIHIALLFFLMLVVLKYVFFSLLAAVSFVAKSLLKDLCTLLTHYKAKRAFINCFLQTVQLVEHLRFSVVMLRHRGVE